MAKLTDETVTAICEKAILEIDSEPVTLNPEMYRVCAQGNDAGAFLRFHGADSGARLAASRVEVQGASGAFKFALAYMRTLIGRKAARRRIEPSDVL